uniref:Uncharacterized protein n=1 Tax=Rhizophora mucronata TaxID=61149 RepID=A0A2P2QES2_RHIMU
MKTQKCSLKVQSSLQESKPWTSNLCKMM